VCSGEQNKKSPREAGFFVVEVNLNSPRTAKGTLEAVGMLVLPADAKIRGKSASSPDAL